MKFLEFFAELYETIKRRLSQSKSLQQSQLVIDFLLTTIAYRDNQIMQFAEKSRLDACHQLWEAVAKNDVNEGSAKNVKHFQDGTFPFIAKELKERKVVTLI